MADIEVEGAPQIKTSGVLLPSAVTQGPMCNVHGLPEIKRHTAVIGVSTLGLSSTSYH